jgi:hypothetical protein
MQIRTKRTERQDKGEEEKGDICLCAATGWRGSNNTINLAYVLFVIIFGVNIIDKWLIDIKKKDGGFGGEMKDGTV